MPPEPRTILDCLARRAGEQPEAPAYLFLKDGETEEARLDYAALAGRARAVAAGLRELGPPGERTLLLYPSGLDFVAALFGCFYAGWVAVPAPPLRRGRERLAGILGDARPRALLSPPGLSPALEDAGQAGLARLETEGLEALPEDACPPPALGGDSLALLQYTSGSTGAPRGVSISHGNLLHNHALAQGLFHHPEGAPIVSWLPLFHDFGLVGGVLFASTPARPRC